MSGTVVLYAGTVSLCIGMALGLLFHLSGEALAVLFVCVAAASLWAAYARRTQVIFVALCVTMVWLGLMRTQLFLAHEHLDSLRAFENETVSITGTIAADPDVRSNEVRANVDVISIQGETMQGRVQAVLPPNTVLAYGERVVFEGKLEAPEPFAGDNGNTFDYPDYLRVKGVSALLAHASLASSTPANYSLLGFLYALKHRFNASIERLLPQPDASLLEGILLGERRGLSKTLTQLFVAAGLIHIVILSGYSMSVVAEGVLRALKFLPKRVALALACAVLILFVILTGAAATTVRAMSMALIALVARYFGRQAAALRSLCVVAAAMALWNPLYLLYDTAFIVSVLSTFGLIAFGRVVESRLPRSLMRAPELRSILASTIAVQILALPALLYFTGTLSLYALPANLLVLPLLPLVMLAGFLAGVFGLVSPAFALAPAFVADALLKFILLVVSAVSALPLSSLSAQSFPLLLAVFLYVPLVALAIWLVRQNALRTRPS